MTKKKNKVIAGNSDASVAGAPRFESTSITVWLAIILGLLAILVWAFWPTVYRLFRDWQDDPNYSVGQLVPLAVIYILWDKRDAWRATLGRPCWWGLVICLAAAAAWYAGLLFLYESAERFGLVLMILGLMLWIGGWRFFRKTFWILIFLFLMLPLPGRIHNAVSGPLQQLATVSTVFLLEIGGVDVTREGNTLTLGMDTRVGIAEACSGLRMLTAFVIVSAAFALLIDRPRWQKIIVLLSSIPIAIICNMIRLIITVAIYKVGNSTAAESFFHDFAGLTMMPVAVLLIFGELSLLKKLILEDPKQA